MKNHEDFHENYKEYLEILDSLELEKQRLSDKRVICDCFDVCVQDIRNYVTQRIDSLPSFDKELSTFNELSSQFGLSNGCGKCEVEAKCLVKEIFRFKD